MTQSQELFWMVKGNSNIDEDLPTLQKILKDMTTVKAALLSSYHLLFVFCFISSITLQVSLLGFPATLLIFSYRLTRDCQYVWPTDVCWQIILVSYYFQVSFCKDSEEWQFT